MRAQLIELTAERCSSSRNAASANIAFTRSWQSSNVPSIAMFSTFGAWTVVICRRCTSLVRPRGCRIAMSMRSLPAKAAIAAEPLHRHVLERQRRAVEQLLDEQVGVELDQRRNGRMAEAGIGVAAQAQDRFVIEHGA